MKKFISKNGVTSQSQSLSGGKPNSEQASPPVVGRRSFLKGLGATGALLVPATALLAAKAKASGASPEKMAAQLKQLAWYRDMYKNPIFFTLLTYAEYLPVGLLISLVAALILKKRSKENTATVN